MNTVKIMAIIGSLRGSSVNRAVARAAFASTGDGIEMEVVDLADVPLYDGDVEEAGVPASVQALHDMVGTADGLLIFSPEYNSSFPAVTKNAIDWLTRPPKAWADTAVAMVVASPGPRAGLGVRSHFEAIMEQHPVRVFPSLGIGSYGDKVTDGEISDQETLNKIAEYVTGFAAFCSEGE